MGDERGSGEAWVVERSSDHAVQRRSGGVDSYPVEKVFASGSVVG